MTTISAVLAETASRGELHHAIVLHGPSRPTLRELARTIAAHLICPSSDGQDDCASCLKVRKGTHPDFHILQVEGERKLISIEQVRAVVAESALRPYEGRSKVFVIDPADAMSASAANALLKTLEEPTADTAFILITRSIDLLLPTIRSRAQSVHVGPEVTPAEATLPLQARRLHRDQAFFELTPEETMEIVRQIVDALRRFSGSGETAALLALAGSLAGRKDPTEALALLVTVLRDLGSIPATDSIDPSGFEEIQRSIPRERLLETAGFGLEVCRRFNVNIEARMGMESVLLSLVPPRSE